MEVKWTDFAVRIIVAFLLGSILGFERQWRQRMAGLRTSTLVSTGSALFVLLSVLTPNDASPTRIAAQVVSGIGFLAGGVILKEGITVRGLNTAATIWCASAIGSLAGGGFLYQAFFGAIAVLLSNTLLRPIAHRINQQSLQGTERQLAYRVNFVCQRKQEIHVRALLLQSLTSNNITLRSLHSEDYNGSTDKVNIEVEMLTQVRDDQFLEQIASRLSLQKGVISVSWRVIEEDFG